MSDLSPDARDLVAHARRHGSELLGPSAEQRAQLREKLVPLWAGQAPQPRAAGGLRWKIGSVAVVAALALLGWLITRSVAERVSSMPLPAAPVASPAPATAPLQSPSTTPPSDEAPAQQGVGHASSPASARGAKAPCEACANSAPTSGKPLAAAAPRRSKRTLPPTSAPTALTSAAASGTVSARESKVPPADDLQAELGLEANRAEAPRIPGRGRTSQADRVPLKAAEERTPERAVQTDADPGPPSIDGELELLGAAQAALHKQRPSRALTLLQEHAFRFPTGAMVEERMAMQALALCALQRRHAAETVLSNLEARGSQSQLLPRVRSQCGL